MNTRTQSALTLNWNTISQDHSKTARGSFGVFVQYEKGTLPVFPSGKHCFFHTIAAAERKLSTIMLSSDGRGIVYDRKTRNVVYTMAL